MAEDFIDVRFTQDDQLQIRGQELEFEEGNVYSLPHNFATKVVNYWDKGELAGNAYEVGEDQVEDKIGEQVSTGNSGSEDSGEDSEAETCEVEKNNGEVCGREKPCPYHD